MNPPGVGFDNVEHAVFAVGLQDQAIVLPKTACQGFSDACMRRRDQYRRMAKRARCWHALCPDCFPYWKHRFPPPNEYVAHNSGFSGFKKFSESPEKPSLRATLYLRTNDRRGYQPSADRERLR